ncbi:MAG: peptide deformylase [Alphaproteobacteria bacterium]|nr:peptide deformylase [Alphaproteobacteria bacterium]
MAILKIARMGHSVLVDRAASIDDPTEERIQRLIGHMKETMADAGGIGLAAPQVYQSLRLILFLDATDREDAQGQDPIVLINPEIEPLDDRVELGVEGCLSMPGLQGIVPRYARIGYRGLSPEGRVIEREADGLHARVVQHEVDHLDGVLYPMRMTDLTQLGFDSEMRHVIERAQREAEIAAKAAEETDHEQSG